MGHLLKTTGKYIYNRATLTIGSKMADPYS